MVAFEKSTSGFTTGGGRAWSKNCKINSKETEGQEEKQAGKRCMKDELKLQRHRHLLVEGGSKREKPWQQNVQLSLLSLIVVHKEIATFRLLITLNGTDDRKNTDSEKYLQE